MKEPPDGEMVIVNLAGFWTRLSSGAFVCQLNVRGFYINPVFFVSPLILFMNCMIAAYFIIFEPWHLPVTDQLVSIWFSKDQKRWMIPLFLLVFRLIIYLVMYLFFLIFTLAKIPEEPILIIISAFLFVAALILVQIARRWIATRSIKKD
jgi:hypothetical protein